ncbi:MAG: DUF2911 domain-containing protein [Flavobacteriaceae bacterium]
MKSIVALVLSIGFSIPLSAQNFTNLDRSPLDISYARPERVADPDIRIIYSRPLLKGREVKDLVPKGKIWRTGANETTEITFYKTVLIEGKRIEAGTYSLYTIPGNRNWTIVLNRKLNTWGAYAYDETQDIGRFSAEVLPTGNPVEVFSISFEKTESGYTLFFAWGETLVALPIQA